MKECVAYYDHAPPHQGIKRHTPIPQVTSEVEGPAHCRDVLGGIIRDYYCKAAQAEIWSGRGFLALQAPVQEAYLFSQCLGCRLEQHSCVATQTLLSILCPQRVAFDASAALLPVADN